MDIRSLKKPETEKSSARKKKINRGKQLIAGLIAAGVLLTAGWFQYGQNLMSWLKNNAGSPEKVCRFIPVKEFQVNLADPGGRRYLRMKICFGGTNKGLAKEISQREPEIRSKVIAILRCMTVEDLEGRQGMERLESEILQQVNSLLSTGQLEKVYFDVFLIQ